MYPTKNVWLENLLSSYHSYVCEAIMCLGYYYYRDPVRVTGALDWSWGHVTLSVSVPSTVGTKKGTETILQSSYEVPRVAEFKE